MSGEGVKMNKQVKHNQVNNTSGGSFFNKSSFLRKKKEINE